MQFIDLAAQQQRIRPQIEANIQNVLNHGKYIMGPEIQALEENLAQFVGVKHCIGCASGTDALLMALMGADAGPGDAVFTTPFTFIATAEVVSLLGATPVFVDIDSRTYNMDPNHLDVAIKMLNNRDLRPRAIIPVDLFGLPCDYNAIKSIAEENELMVIEDAAQGLGGVYKGEQACSLGDMGCTSFFPAKPLGCYGDGGAVFTNDEQMVEKLRSIRMHGQGGHKYDHVRLGLNARLDALQAAILLPKLQIFPEEVELRQKVAQGYTGRLSESSKLVTPFVPEGYQSVWAQYSILAQSPEARDHIQTMLKDAGIPTAIYYPKPLHLQPAFQNLGYQNGDFPISEDTAQRIFSIPMHPYLEEEDLDKICKAILAAVNS